MAESTLVDRLPPESRFALRAVASGLSVDEAAAVLRVDGDTARKHLRTAVRRLGGSVVAPAGGWEALDAALTPHLAAGREPPVKKPATPCPTPDVADALAASRLDGPLMLAEIEHAADCPACLARLVATRKSGVEPAADVASTAKRKSPWPVVVGVAVGLAAAAWYLLR